jgi:hypothetical protein
MTKIEKFSLDFVNNGDGFVFPKWTVAMHESAMARMLEDKPKATSDERESLFRYYVIHESLLQVDENVTLEDVKSLHPENLVILFNSAYTSGKRDIYFRKGKKSPKD